MTRIGLTHRLAAATIAVLVTTSTVWGMANLGHPAKAAPVVLAKQSCRGS